MAATKRASPRSGLGLPWVRTAVTRTESPPPNRLRDTVRGVRARRRLIVGVVLLTVLPTLVISLLQTPIYAAHAEVLRPGSGGSGARTDASREIQTEIRILESEPVRAFVRQQVGSAPDVTGERIAGTDLIRVTAKNTDPKQAAVVANTYAGTYVEYRRAQAVDELLGTSQQVQARITEIDRQAGQAPAGAQKDALEQAKGVLRQELDQLRNDGGGTDRRPQLVTQAAIPTEPVAPRPVRNGVIALAVGLALGLVAAFVRELLDDSIKTKAQFERVGGDVPVLGLIPLVGDWKTKDNPRLVSLTQPNSPAAEAYRTLRTAVQSLAVDRPLRSLLVTSCNAREGKTTTVANLAVALAKSGVRVVVVCCDLRRPRVHEFFGLSNEVGFTSVILGKAPLTGALQEVPEQPRLHVLASGPLPPNPSELLSSKRTAEVLAALQIDADIVLLDSPPVLPVTDALVLSERVDATLLVSSLRATSQREVVRSVELLAQVGAPLMGAVVNGVSEDGPDAYGFGYYTNGSSSNGRQGTGPGNGAKNRAPATRRERLAGPSDVSL